MKVICTNEIKELIEVLSCQISCLEQAERLNMLSDEDQRRLNTLIIKRAHCRKELQEMSESQDVISVLVKKFTSINYFSHRTKRISDYFQPKPTN